MVFPSPPPQEGWPHPLAAGRPQQLVPRPPAGAQDQPPALVPQVPRLPLQRDQTLRARLVGAQPGPQEDMRGADAERPLQRLRGQGLLRDAGTCLHAGPAGAAGRVLYTDPQRGGGCLWRQKLGAGSEMAALRSSASVLVSSLAWPKVFLVRSLVGPCFLGLFCSCCQEVPCGGCGDTETAGCGARPGDHPVSLPQPRGATGRRRSTVTQVGRESWGNGDGHAGQAEMLMVIAVQDSHQAAKRVFGVYLLFVVFFFMVYFYNCKA